MAFPPSRFKTNQSTECSIHMDGFAAGESPEFGQHHCFTATFHSGRASGADEARPRRMDKPFQTPDFPDLMLNGRCRLAGNNLKFLVLDGDDEKEESDMTAADTALNNWLRDAHAMEEQALTMLKGHESRLESYPELRARISQHIRETERQAQMVRGCLERRNTDTSGLKDAGAKLTALGQSLSGIFVSDEVMKGSLASYTFEHMEIASYRMLAEAASFVGDSETQRVCEEIMREEEAMAQWLAEHAGEVTRTYLAREETDSDRAKR
jgi:ferritin-like metal-binding protein YciE